MMSLLPSSQHGWLAAPSHASLDWHRGGIGWQVKRYNSPSWTRIIVSRKSMSSHRQFQVPGPAPAPGRKPRAKLQSLTDTLQRGQTTSEVVKLSGELNIALEAARTEEKLRAAATLRARSFYEYPEDRSMDAIMRHQRMKAEDEWASLTRKVGGMEPGYDGTTCVVALCRLSHLPDTGSDLQSRCKCESSEERVVVGTLDINLGLVLPGEIPGDHPQGLDAEHCRAYLSNVCVAQEVRRRGVGMILMVYAKKISKLWGVSSLYVHVVADNLTARQLYEKAGFVYEKEETERVARSLARPRRFLLRAQL